MLHHSATHTMARMQNTRYFVPTEHKATPNFGKFQSIHLLRFKTLKGALNPKFLNLTKNREKYCL